MYGRRSLLLVSTLVLVVGACARGSGPAPVRTPMRAVEIAQQTLRAAGLDEEVVAAQRRGDAWLVTTRWRETSRAGHLVTVDAATGKVTVERYRTLELGPPRPGEPG